MRSVAGLTACRLHAGAASGQSPGVEDTQSVGLTRWFRQDYRDHR